MEYFELYVYLSVRTLYIIEHKQLLQYSIKIVPYVSTGGTHATIRPVVVIYVIRFCFDSHSSNSFKQVKTGGIQN